MYIRDVRSSDTLHGIDIPAGEELGIIMVMERDRGGQNFLVHHRKILRQDSINYNRRYVDLFLPVLFIIRFIANPSLKENFFLLRLALSQKKEVLINKTKRRPA